LRWRKPSGASKKKQEVLKLNGTHQLLANADDVNKNTESLLDATKEVGLEMNSEKTKYMMVSPKKAGKRTT
jgi:hypothetical protein